MIIAADCLSVIVCDSYCQPGTSYYWQFSYILYLIALKAAACCCYDQQVIAKT